MVGGPWPMCMRRRRCLVFAVLPASGQLPRLARAARRAQGRRKGTFRKLDAKNVVLSAPGGSFSSGRTTPLENGRKRYAAAHAPVAMVRLIGSARKKASLKTKVLRKRRACCRTGLWSSRKEEECAAKPRTNDTYHERNERQHTGVVPSFPLGEPCVCQPWCLVVIPSCSLPKSI